MSESTYKDALDTIVEMIQYLSPEDQIRLINEIRANLQINKEDEPVHSITELEGLGKEIWAGIDPQEYVDRERDSWDNGPSYHTSDETHNESDKL